jgi:hypothetical protein
LGVWLFISKLKDNYKVKITGHVKDIGDDATMREPVGGFCDDIVCADFIDHDTAIFSFSC